MGNSNEKSYRYERKFLIEQLSLQQVNMIIRYNPFLFSEIYHQRYVNNIYFDSPGLSSYNDNIIGYSNRKKVRIRWYDDLFGVINYPVLEIKSKRGLVGSKKSFPLQTFNLNDNTMFNDIQQLFHDSSIPEIINFMNVKPMLINRYKRNYFQSADKNYRITVDTNLVFYNFSFQSISFLKMFNFGSNVILELKYQPNEDLTANEVTNHFPFRMTKMSKYVIGIEKIFL